jgi:DnaJ-class molecular chaperone
MNNYTILEIPNGSSKEVIKKAYRTLTKKHHPDKGGDQTMFVKVKTAYDELLKGITGGQTRQEQYQSAQYDIRSYMETLSTTLNDDGSATFKFRLNNVSHIEFNGGHYPIKESKFTVTKEQLVDVNYTVKMTFIGLNNMKLDKEWNVRKPLTKWQKLKKALTLSIFR